VAPGDRIKISVCLYNLNGFVDAQFLEWAKPKSLKIDESMNFMTYNREKQLKKICKKSDQKIIKYMKIICDQDRVSDVEDSVRYWNQ